MALAQDADATFLKMAGGEPGGGADAAFLKMAGGAVPQAVPQSGDDAFLAMAGAKPAMSPKASPGVSDYIQQGATVLAESALNERPGQMGATWRVSRSQGGAPQQAAYSRLGDAASRLFSGGKTPAFEDMEFLARSDPKFGERWTALKARKAEGEDYALRAYGPTPDWNDIQRRYALGRHEEAQAAGTVAANALPSPSKTLPPEIQQAFQAVREERAAAARGAPEVLLRQGGLSMTVPRKEMQLERTPFDAQLEEYHREAREGPPGITRPPLTKDELAAVAWQELLSQSQDEQKIIPERVQAGLRGVGKGFQVAGAVIPVGRAARALGGVVRAAAPLLEGAAASGVSQGLALASGAQNEFSVGDVLKSAATMGVASKIGRTVSEAMPARPALGATVGTLGTLEGASVAERAMTGDTGRKPGESPWESFANHVIESGAMVATAGALGAAKPNEVKPKPRTGESDYAKAEQTAAALGDNLRRLFRGDKKGEDYSGRINEEFLPNETAMLKAAQDVQAFVEQVAPRNRKAQEAIRLALHRVVEDPAVAAAIPNKPPGFEQGVALMKRFGEVGGLEAGRKLGKYGILGSEVDAAGAPISGLAAAEQRGHYLPQNVRGKAPDFRGEMAGPPTTSSRESMPNAPDARAPLASESVRGHLKQRTMTLEEKIAKGLPIDSSHGAMVAVLADEFGAARKAARLELARADQRFTETPTEGFVRLEGKEWGKYEGGYLDPAVWKAARAERFQKTPVAQLFSTLIAKSKRALVVYTPVGWLRDTVGNMRKVTQLGLPTVPYLAEKVRAMSVAYGERARDETDHAFFALKRSSNMGTSADVAQGDSPGVARLRSRIKAAEETREGALPLKGALAIERVADKLGNLPGVKQIPKIRNALVDEADMLAAFRTAVKYGIDDSGPMSYQQAFDRVVKPLWDYGTLGPKIQTAASFASFLRWRAKTLQALGRAAVAKPDLYGVNIPEPFTPIIRANPTGKAAQAALVARATMRIALHASEWLVPMAGAQAAQLHQLGAKKADLDRYLDGKYSYLPEALRWFIKQTFIPFTRNRTGFTGMDGASLIPELEAVRYFLPSSETPLAWQGAEKNLLGGAAAEIVAGRDYFGHNVPHGTTGERAQGAARSLGERFVPGARSIEALVSELQLPENERNVLLTVLQSVVGVPVTQVDEPGKFDPKIDDWIARGIVGWQTRDDGSANLYVRQPATREGEQAKLYLDMNPFTSKASLQRYLRRQRERQLERAGMR